MKKIDVGNLLIKIFILLFSVILFYSCTKEPQDIETVTLTDDLYIAVTDTISPQYVVYRLDSFQTSGSNTAIIGGVTDPAFGRIEVKAFARFKLATNNYQTVGAENEYYDSIVLIMHTDSSFYGDTLTKWSVNVHKLWQEFDASNPYYNNHSLVSFEEELGNATVQFRPHVDDSIRVKLDQSFGEEIFNLYKKKDTKITTQEEFQRFFKGLSINSAVSNNVIYRFPINDSSLLIRLYYHEDLGSPVNKYLDFSAEGGSFQFNNISCDVSGSPLSDLAPGAEIRSEALDHHFYLNDLAGIGTKINFPSAYVMATLPDFIRVSDALLYIKPAINSFIQFPLVPSLGMSLSSETSTYASALYSSDNSYVQDGNLYIDLLKGEQTGYTYDVGSLVRSEISATPSTSVTAHLQAHTNGSVNTFSMNRLVANDNSHPSRPSTLQIQMIFYKK